jgi:hypothetical protein
MGVRWLTIAVKMVGIGREALVEEFGDFMKKGVF